MITKEVAITARTKRAIEIANNACPNFVGTGTEFLFFMWFVFIVKSKIQLYINNASFIFK